jgi:hypothetical protein
MLRELLWNPTERRLRLPCRLVGTLLTLVVALILADAAMGLLDSVLGPRTYVVVETAAGIAAFVGTLWVAGRWIDRRRFGSFGLDIGPQWWLELFAGLVLGAMLISAVFGLELLLGFLTIDEVGYVAMAGSLPWALTVSTLGYLLVAVSEELLFRGYLLKNVAEAGSPWVGPRRALLVGTVVSSVAFAGVHAGNPAATPTSTVALGVLGVLFSVAYVYTGELALPVGLHLTWNVVQGPVYGFPVSGWPITEGSVLRTTQHGPTWLTGGAFGPEAGLLGLGAMATGAVCIIAGTRWLRRTGPATSLATYVPSTRARNSPARR